MGRRHLREWRSFFLVGTDSENPTRFFPSKWRQFLKRLSKCLRRFVRQLSVLGRLLFGWKRNDGRTNPLRFCGLLRVILRHLLFQHVHDERHAESDGAQRQYRRQSGMTVNVLSINDRSSDQTGGGHCRENFGRCCHKIIYAQIALKRQLLLTLYCEKGIIFCLLILFSFSCSQYRKLPISLHIFGNTSIGQLGFC